VAPAAAEIAAAEKYRGAYAGAVYKGIPLYIEDEG
jgi:hypothetical protein